MVNEQCVEPAACVSPVAASASKMLLSPMRNNKLNDHNNNNEDELDDNAEAEAALHNFALSLKQRADELMRTERYRDALPLYRDLLMHLSKSHVRLLHERALVVSCRMNVLGAMSKLQQWSQLPTEATNTLHVIVDLMHENKQQQLARDSLKDNNSNNNNNNNSADDANYADQTLVIDSLARVHYFRGYAHFQLGSFAAADADFRKAMELSPTDHSFEREYQELQTAMQCEKRVKDLLHAARQHFQHNKPKHSIDCSLEALRECHVLQHDAYTGLVHSNLAAAYSTIGDDAQAIEHYKRALVFARKATGQAQTAQQCERSYDLLSALATCYARRQDFSSAHSVLLDAIALFPHCPTRQDLKAQLYVHAGRVSLTLGKFENAASYFQQADAAATAATRLQLPLALTALLWLAKTYRAQQNDAAAATVLAQALARVASNSSSTGASNDAAVDELVDQLLLAQLELLDPLATTTLNSTVEDADDATEAVLWRAFEHFCRKRQVQNHLRAARVLVRWLLRTRQTTDVSTMDDDATRTKLERALVVVDTIPLDKLVTMRDVDDSVASYVELVLVRVDLVLASPRTDAAHSAQLLLVTMLTAMPPPALHDCTTQRVHKQALARFAALYSSNSDEEDGEEADDKVTKCAAAALAALRSDASAAALLCRLLLTLARRAARRSDSHTDAAALLDESATVARRVGNSELLGEALVGRCVLHLQQRNVAQATAMMNEIDALPTAQRWHELNVVRDQLHAARKADAAAAQAAAQRQPRVRAEKEVVQVTNAVRVGWWGRWWFVVSVAVVGAAMLLLQVLELQHRHRLDESEAAVEAQLQRQP